MRHFLLFIGAIIFTIGATATFLPALYDLSPQQNVQQDDKRLKEKEQEIETLQLALDESNETIATLQRQLDEQLADDEKVTEKEKPKKATTKIVITIEDGVRSPDVAISLAEAQIVDDAEQFNAFLKEKGYASQIQLGTYEIDPAMDYETIAKIITKQMK